MKPEVKAHLKQRMNAVRSNASFQVENKSVVVLFDVLETVIDSLPEAKQPKLKPRGAGRGI